MYQRYDIYTIYTSDRKKAKLEIEAQSRGTNSARKLSHTIVNVHKNNLSTSPEKALTHFRAASEQQQRNAFENEPDDGKVSQSRNTHVYKIHAGRIKGIRQLKSRAFIQPRNKKKNRQTTRRLSRAT